MRYIGCKSKLLKQIDKEISMYCGKVDGKVFCDLFAGTGSVGDWFQNRCKIIANDNLYFSYVINRGKLLKPKSKFKKLSFDPFAFFNKAKTDNYTKGYCYNNFAPSVSNRRYFSDENAKLIDYIRETIEKWFKEKKISDDEHDYLIACLIESVSKVSNVAGVYAAFLHTWDCRAVKRMKFIDVENINEPKFDNIVFNQDANTLIRKLKGDILYLDPPYTPTQYISQYHVLETIAKNDHPATHGVGAHRDNGKQISNWSKKYVVANELEQVIANANFKYIVMSYSDAGLLSKGVIEAIFKRYAKKGSFVFKKYSFVKYKNTRAVNREKRENTKNKEHYEWLFIMEKANYPKYVSPLNYIGGKFDVLNFLLPNFPKKIGTFFDLFGGGGNVVINSKAKRYVYNDINFIVKNLLKYIKDHDVSSMYKYIDKTIEEYGLSKGDKKAYNKFRKHYNSLPINKRHPLDLYLLICYGFEHQIRFNATHEFNNPIGNSGFNDEMLEKLISFHSRTREINLEFNSTDYKKYLNKIKKGDFVYCDPPYLLTRGVYNDGKRGFNGWDEKQQNELFKFLDELNNRKISFALSYVIKHNGISNNELKKWIEKNKYNLVKNPKTTKRNRQDRREVIITNYGVNL